MNEPKITINGMKMTIEVDLDTPGEKSASGKSMTISSTKGNKKFTTAKGEVSVGLNIYRALRAGE